MASVIKLKRSSTPGAVPAGSDLQVGEVAVNLADRVIFAKQAGGAVVRIGESALANTNARINLLNTNLTGTNSAIRTLVTAEASRIDLVNTNLTSTNSAIRTLVTAAQGAGDQALADVQSTNTAIRTLITSNDTDIATLTSRVDLVNTNLTATNTAIRLLLSLIHI